MLGNVSEQVQDWYAEDYYQHSPTVDPQGPDAGDTHVIRGGDWIVDAQVSRAASRLGFVPFIGRTLLGFRCSSADPHK